MKYKEEKNMSENINPWSDDKPLDPAEEDRLTKLEFLKALQSATDPRLTEREREAARKAAKWGANIIMNRSLDRSK